ncbi:hypothetical protein Pen02_08430 [Plantactinospora endophytica]|uniref:Uncharacterized protein n=1 Tax=Plantactinospora endophytica TaxID=673535 RepID=A0ABQ4DUY0_9ACTN|nr:hypothetical protein Pen02_08430 [Plantactinospora endophytica]
MPLALCEPTPTAGAVFYRTTTMRDKGSQQRWGKLCATIHPERWQIGAGKYAVLKSEQRRCDRLFW